MAGVWHFLEGTKQSELVAKGKVKEDARQRWKLADLVTLDDKLPDDVMVMDTVGPGGASGVMLYPKGPDDPEAGWGYNAQRQEWFEVTAICGCDDKRWAAYDLSSPPTPESLARSGADRLGYSISDNLGGKWRVPAARSPDVSRSDLAVGFFPTNGSFRESVQHRDRELWDASGEVLSHLTGDDTLTRDRLIEICYSALQYGYRLDAAVMEALRRCDRAPLSTHTLPYIMSSIIDGELLDEWSTVAKNSEAGTDSRVHPGSHEPGTGPEVVSPPTGQVVLN